nr:hypothetical protein [Prevotella sp.]
MAAVRIVIALLFGQSWGVTQEDMYRPNNKYCGMEWKGVMDI